MRKMEELKDYIHSQVPQAELLALLAEEAAELAQAALKLRRVYDGTNPTPTTELSAAEALREELGDVFLVSILLDEYQGHQLEIDDMMAYKLNRWKDRLEALKNSTKLEKTR